MSQTFRVYTFLAPALLPVYESVTNYLARALGCRAELHVGRSYDELAQADFSFICGLPYILRTPPRQTPALLRALAAPVLSGERYRDRPIYFSDVIVHRDSMFDSFTDLRACAWAYNEPESQSGYGITRYHLAQMGETRGYFGRVIEAGFHQHAIKLVAERQADATAIDSHVLAVVTRVNPALAAQLRIIASLGPSTIQPFAAAARLPPSLQQDVQSALAVMHEDAETQSALERGMISRFVAVNDAAYDDIREMLAVCEQADFLTLR